MSAGIGASGQPAFDVLACTASRMSPCNPAWSMVAPSAKSMPRTVLPVSRVLKSFLGSFQLSTLGKGQPNRVLEQVGKAENAIVRPDRYAFRLGRLLPLHLFDQLRIRLPDDRAQLSQ